MRSSVVVLVAAAFVRPGRIGASEPRADIWQAVGRSEHIVIATVKEVRPDGTVVLTVHEWIKGTPVPSGELSLRGETGHCVVRGPVSRFMKKGQRFLVFVFPGGKPGRLGHIQKVKPDGTFPGGRPANLNCGPDAPATAAELANLIRHIASPEFVKEQIALLKDPDRKVVRAAVRRLGGAVGREAFDAIVKLARDRNTGAATSYEAAATRNEAIRALGRLTDPGALEQLVDILEKEGHPWVSVAACALGETGDRRAAGALVRALGRAMAGERDTPHPGTCLGVLRRLGVCDRDTAHSLARALRIRGEHPGSEAVRFVWERKLRWMTPALARAMGSTNRYVARNAGRALADMAGMSFRSPREGERRVRLSRDEVLALAGEALAADAFVAKGVSPRGREPEVRDVNGAGWLAVYPPPDEDILGASYYVYVGDREKKAEVLLVAL